MSDLTIFFVGIVASTLCLIFFLVTVIELRRAGREPVRSHRVEEQLLQDGKRWADLES